MSDPKKITSTRTRKREHETGSRLPAEDALREREEIYSVIVDQSRDAIALIDILSGRFIEFNEAAHNLLGYSREEFAALNPEELDPGFTPETTLRNLARLRESGGAVFETRLRHQDGHLLDVRASCRLIRIKGRDLVSVIWFDITERIEAETRLRVAEERFELAMRGANDGLWDWNLLTDDVYYSPRWKSMVGYSDEELVGHLETWKRLVHPDDQQITLDRVDDLTSGRIEKYEVEFRMQHRDGHYLDVLSRAFLVHDAQGKAVRLVGTHVDISERKQTEARLESSLSLLRATLESTADGILVVDREGHIATHNHRFAEMWRLPADLLEKRDDAAAIDAVLEQLVAPQKFLDKVQQLYGDPGASSFDVLHFKDGRVFERYSQPQRLGVDIVGRVWSFRDLTDRERSVHALAESEEKYRTLAEFADDWVYWLSPDGQFSYVSPSCEHVTGYRAEDFEAQPKLLESIVHPEDWERFGSHMVDAVRGKIEAKKIQIRIIARNGEEHWIEHTCRKMYDQNGTYLGRRAGNRDITERVRGEQARTQLETQLRLAQKMEALGTLAGGVAHDFNNILVAITGNVELATQDVDPEHPARESLAEIQKASRRAKDLVQRILAFSSRHPQSASVATLQPIVEEAVRLLRASLPADVDVVTTFGRDIPAVRAETSQIEQVLLNLCTNAWQALGGSAGRIDVALDGIDLDAETAAGHPNLQPGRFARLTVTDNGSGMTAATMDRIFDPFFTTKPPGQGTGLGLSVVHSIVKAHGGVVCVSSQLREGTTFTMYFPAAEREQIAEATPASSGSIAARRVE